MPGPMPSAPVSIAGNIAEGAPGGGGKGFIPFPDMAADSASELDVRLEIPLRIGTLDRQDTFKILEKAHRAAGVIQGLKIPAKELSKNLIADH